MYKCVEDWSGMIMSFQQPTKSYEILAGVLKSSSSDFISSIKETWPRIKFLGVFLAWHYSCEGGSPPWVDFSGNFHIFVPSLTRQRDGGLRAASAGLCVCVDVFTGGWTELGWLAQTSPAWPPALCSPGRRERFWISAQKRTSVSGENMWGPWSRSQ